MWNRFEQSLHRNIWFLQINCIIRSAIRPIGRPIGIPKSISYFRFHSYVGTFDFKTNVHILFNLQYPLENNSLSVLRFKPTIEDDGKYLTCRAENPAISNSALEDKWRLDVQYQPVVSLRMGETLNPDDIKEGDDVYFECIVRANPKVYKLAWFKDVSIANIRVSIMISARKHFTVYLRFVVHLCRSFSPRRFMQM